MGQHSASDLTVHRLAVLREKLADMASRTGVRIDVFSRAERGRLPDVWTWEQLARAYRLTPSEFVRKALPTLTNDKQRKIAEAYLAEEERRLQTPAPASQSA